MIYPCGVPCGSDPMTLAHEDAQRETEAERVEVWRLKVLLDAGYPLKIAERLAERPDIDLHLAVRLIEQGCRPGMAALILL